MYERILVPLDGSELAEQALRYAETVARRCNSEVILFTACTPGDWLHRPLRAYLESKAKEFKSSGIKVSTKVVQGSPATEILNFAKNDDIGLIIISSHGRTGATLWVLGGVANKVLRRSRGPTLLVRSSKSERLVPNKELRKILLPLDGSEFAEAAIPYVENLAKGPDNEVVLLTVVEPISIPLFAVHSGGFDWEKYEKDVMSKVEKEARHYLTRKENSLRDKGLAVSSAMLIGKPAKTILQYAEDNSIDLIGLSSHGLSGITKWVYGSTASKIIEGSSKPVLLIRPPVSGLGT